MNDTPRFDLVVAADLSVAFLAQNNNSFTVDTWEVSISATGDVFRVNILGFRDFRPGSVPMFGSAKSANGPVWGYKDDERVKDGFSGLVQVVPYSGTTYAVFRSRGHEAAVQYALPLCDLLLQRKSTMTPTQSGRVKVAIAKALDINAVLSKEEDDAVSYSVRVIYTDPQTKSRLEKVANVHAGHATYQVVDASGNLQHGPFPTMSEGQLAIGHVPQAPKVAPGGKTNVGGDNWVKGKTGDGGSQNTSKQSAKGSKGKSKAA